MTHLDAAIAELHKERDVTAARLRHLDDALSTLGRLSGAQAEPRRTTRIPEGPSIRRRLVGLFEEADRDWSAGEMVFEFDKRGVPLAAGHPLKATRSTLASLYKANVIERTGPGRYRAAKWAGVEPAA